MDDDYEDEIGSAEPVSVRWCWVAFVVRIIEMFANVFRAFADGMNEIANMAAEHNNYIYDQREFADEMRAEIDSLPTTES